MVQVDIRVYYSKVCWVYNITSPNIESLSDHLQIVSLTLKMSSPWREVC